MGLQSILCFFGRHRWQQVADAVGPDLREQHADRSNRSNPAHAHRIVCARCGEQRAWSFSRGRWVRVRPLLQHDDNG